MAYFAKWFEQKRKHENWMIKNAQRTIQYLDRYTECSFIFPGFLLLLLQCTEPKQNYGSTESFLWKAKQVSVAFKIISTDTA